MVKNIDGKENAQDLRNVQIQALHPDADLYKFTGEVNLAFDKAIELDLKQFLHRGSTLKNSNFVDALVIYTGIHTKIVMNQGKYEFKQSQVDKAINLMTIWNMFVIFFLALIMTVKSFKFL